MPKYASTLIKQAQSWIGCNEADGSHRKIIDVYNSHKPLARGYAVKYTDAWCSTFVSACAIACGMTDIIPTECGCEKHTELFKKAGTWIEDESVTPKPGYIIFYDWDDNGVGDNNGYADHVGIVEKVSGGKITVIEGNCSNSVKRRTLDVNGRYIRGYGAPKYDPEGSQETVTPVKHQIARSKTATADPKTVWDYLVGKIGNKYGVAGLMGNLYAESGLKPINLQNSYEKKLGFTDDSYTDAVDSGSYTNFVKDSAGYGLAQWTYWSRKQGLLEYAQSVKSSIGNVTTQLEYLWKEIQGYKTVLEVLKSAKSVKEASDIVLTGFERPADKSDAVKIKRAGYGQSYYDKYAGSVTVDTPTQEVKPTPVTPDPGLKIDYAQSKESGYGGGKVFKTTTSLNFRTGAGTGKKVIKVLDPGTPLTWYGYYTLLNNVKWYLVVDKTGQTGFVSSLYLK